MKLSIITFWVSLNYWQKKNWSGLHLFLFRIRWSKIWFSLLLRRMIWNVFSQIYVLGSFPVVKMEINWSIFLLLKTLAVVGCNSSVCAFCFWLLITENHPLQSFFFMVFKSFYVVHLKDWYVWFSIVNVRLGSKSTCFWPSSEF